MTYTLNALVVGAETAVQVSSGRAVAQPDTPSSAALEVGSRVFQGVRYLVGLPSESGYPNVCELVYIPIEPSAPARLRIPDPLWPDVSSLLQHLLGTSPCSKLIVYLEANRVISRSDETDPFPVVPTVAGPVPMRAILGLIQNDRFHEEEVFIVEGRSSPAPERDQAPVGESEGRRSPTSQ